MAPGLPSGDGMRPAGRVSAPSESRPVPDGEFTRCARALGPKDDARVSVARRADVGRSPRKNALGGREAGTRINIGLGGRDGQV
jgi:hypothetical protein